MLYAFALGTIQGKAHQDSLSKESRNRIRAAVPTMHSPLRFPLFDQKGAVMDQASLVTYLSESLLIPSTALQEYIVWEAIDDLHAKATISCYGMSVNGVFTFNEKGEMLSFLTDDRSAVATDGSSEKVKWSVVYDEYEETDGIRRPTVFRAIWHYEDGDLVYFDGEGTVTAYN